MACSVRNRRRNRPARAGTGPRRARGGQDTMRRTSFLLLLLALGCAGAAKSERVVTQPPSEYRIGREDVLEIAVWHEPELSRVMPVRPDGFIALPLVGEIEAAGKTPLQLRQELAK